MKLFAAKKIRLTACRMYRNIWETGKPVEFQRESYYSNYVRLAGYINGIHYQVHINSAEISARVRDLSEHRDTDDELSRIFSVACACADFGEYYKKYKHLAAALILNV